MAQETAAKMGKAVPQEKVRDAKRPARRFIRERMRFILPAVLRLALSWTIGCRLSASSAPKSSVDAAVRCVSVLAG